MIVSRFTFHFVCLPCRRAIKSGVRQPHLPCPTCQGEMKNLGRKFAAPRKKDDAQWKKLEWMVRNGWRGYGSATRPPWPTQPKMNLREVQESFVVGTQAQKAAAKAKEDGTLLERRRAANSGYSLSKTAQKRMKAELKRQEEYQKRVLSEVQSKRG